MTSPMLAPDPGAAFDAFLRDAAPSTLHRPLWTPDDGPMPALYLGHGAPPLLDDPLWIAQLSAWTSALPTPTAVLVVSAHWETAPVRLSATGAAAPLVYDFGGFAERYSTMTYPTPDASALAGRVGALLADPVGRDEARGLDHGAWVPLKVMYPYADVPVLQLSIPTHEPERLLDLGRALRPLREEGVLLVGSGFLTHGLPFLTRDEFLGNSVPDWSRDFDGWAASALDRGDLGALLAYRESAPGLRYAHPTVEHLVPLFVTLGAAADPAAPVETVIDGFWAGLSKRSFQVE